MELATLADELASLLPYVAVGGQAAGRSVAEVTGRTLGTRAAKALDKIWQKLSPTLEADATGRRAVQRATEDPDNRAVQAALASEIRRVLTNNPRLAEEISSSYDITIRGNKNVVQIGTYNRSGG